MKITTKDTLLISWGKFEGSNRYSMVKFTGEHFTVNDMTFILLKNQNKEGKTYTLSEDFLAGKVQNLSNISSSKEITLNI